MNFYLMLFSIIFIPTIIIFLMHKITYKHNNKFSNFINTLWNEYFEEQMKAIIYTIIFFSIIGIITLLIYIGNYKN